MTLVERLRKGSVRYYSRNRPVYSGPTSLEREAADRIESLEAELSKAREAALEEAAKVANRKWQEYQGPFGSQAATTCAHEIEVAIRSLSHKEG